MSTLARVLDSLIRKGKTEGIEEKIDVFYATGKLTEAEYEYLMKELYGGDWPPANETPEEPENVEGE